MLPTLLADPDTGQPVDAALFTFDVAVDPVNGNLYAVWTDARFSNGRHDSIAFSMSTDGGLTWSAPIQVNKTPTNIASGNQHAYIPSVAVAADGTVAVTCYDFRFNDANPGLLTDYWIVQAHPAADLTNPANWGNELRLTDTSFDLEKASVREGFFLGDYQGLTGAGNDFVAFFSQTHGTDPGSIFFRRIDPPIAVSSFSNGVSASVNLDGMPLADLSFVYRTTNAASSGSVIDPTPADNREFTTPGNQGIFAPTGRIVAYGQAGDDDIQVAGAISLPAWLYGGDGNDRLKGGSGPNVLLGGAGDDLLVGGSNRDILIGGTGADRLVGNANDDILIAGTTAFDSIEAALSAILAEWTSARDYATRVANLQGTGSGPRLNGNTFFQANTTVLDDGSQDVLTGSSGQDWFWANYKGAGVLDKITDLSASEFANDLDFIKPMFENGGS